MTKQPTPEEQQRAFFDGLLNLAIRPHADQIASIWGRGEVAVVVHELTPRGEAAARYLGWKGDAQPFALSRADAEQMAQHCASQGDFVTGPWLARADTLRIFAIVHNAAALLINHVLDEGFSLEPNSTDAGWKN